MHTDAIHIDIGSRADLVQSGQQVERVLAAQLYTLC